jgi:hypothetical protein
MRLVRMGRLSIGFFPYWIGVSWRKVGGLGRVLDLGYVKFVI